MFADDTTSYSRHKHTKYANAHLQKQLDLKTPWIKIWRLELNATKTAAVLEVSTKNP